MIRDRIVVGIRNTSLSERLQLDPKLTLESAVTQVRQSETVKQQQAVLRGSSTLAQDIPVGAVQRGRSNRKGKPFKGVNPGVNKGSQSSATSRDNPKGCSRCGKLGFHDKANYPAKDAICRRCNKRGHFQVVCRSAAKVAGVQSSARQDTSCTTDDAFLGALEHPDRNDPGEVTLTLEGQPVTLSIDTGAEVTVIPDNVWRDLGKPALTLPAQSLKGPDAKPIHSQGKFSDRLSLHNREATEEIYVVPGLTKALLGRHAIDRLHLIRRLASVQKMQDPKEQFPSLFKGLGKLEQPYMIQLQEDAKPFALSTPPQSGDTSTVASPARAGAYGKDWSHFSSESTDRVVCRYGGGAKSKWEGPDMRRSHQTQRVCSEGEASTTSRRADTGTAGRSKVLLQA